MYKWTASNNNSFLQGPRTAKSILAAVRAGRHYVWSELYGEGMVVIMDMDDTIIRTDERGLQTGYRWVVNTDRR